MPLSSEFLASLKVCCGCGCLNCPYIPKHTKGSTDIREGLQDDSVEDKEREDQKGS